MTINTEVVTGAEPVAPVAGEPAKDVKVVSSPAEPWHKDPRFKNDLGLLKSAKGLMEANQLESFDDLRDLLEEGKKVRGKGVDLSRIDEIVAKANQLDQYEAFWKEDAERKKRSGEMPDETVKRLETELRKREAKEKQDAAAKKAQDTAQQALSTYESEVKTLIKSTEIPDKQIDFVQKFFGIGNPCNDIDITDRKAVRKMYTDLTKSITDFKQTVIAEYLETKKGIPPVSPTTTSTDEVKVTKNLKDARRQAREQLMAHFIK